MERGWELELKLEVCDGEGVETVVGGSVERLERVGISLEQREMVEDCD